MPYPTRSSIGLNYPFLFPDTKLDPDKLSNLAIQSFSTLTLNQYPGYWYDFVFLWSDSVTKIKGNHTLKGGVSVERSGMKDQIQLSAAAAPATTNQNGSFRFTDGTRADGSGLAVSNALLGLFDDYTEFGTKPLTNFIGMGYDFYGQDSWKATRNLTIELGLRYSLWQQWRDENNAIASFQSEFYDPARAVTIDRANGSVVPGSGDPFNGIVLPGDSATDEALQLFPQLADLGRLYHDLPPGFAPDPKDGLQPRLGMAYGLSDTWTIRSGIGRFLNRPQINTSAAYGFNPPLSEMATVINGNVDAPAGAARRTFPLVMAMFSPDYANASSWAWNVTTDRQMPLQHTMQLSYVGRSASNLERARNINQLQPGTIQGNPGVNANALRPLQRLRQHHAVRDHRQVDLQRDAAAGVAPHRPRPGLLGRLHVVEDEGRRQHPARDPAERLRRQRLLRHLRARPAARADHPGLLPDAGADVGSGSAQGRVRRLEHRWRVPGAVGCAVRRHHDGGRRRCGSGQRRRSTYNIVGDPDTGRTEFDGTRAVWFNKDAFRIPTAGTYATTCERNNLRQPGFWDLHMSLRKSVAVGTHRVELRWDVFNVLNHPTLGLASTNPTAADFGTITSKTGSRTMQIGLQSVF